MKWANITDNTETDRVNIFMQQPEVSEFYISMEKCGVTVWIDGGWGVDALLENRPGLIRIWILPYRRRMLQYFGTN